METKKDFESSEVLCEYLKKNRFDCSKIPKEFFDFYDNVLKNNISAKRSFLNWIMKKPPTPSYLSGPYTLTKHTHPESGENNWTSDFHVYVFGERHGEKGCSEWNDFLSRIGSEKSIKDESKIMGVHDFLRGVAETSPVFLDIFIEMQRMSWEEEKKIEEDGMERVFINNIGRIHEIFRKKMAYIDNKTIEFERMENVRVHAIDERRSHAGAFLYKYYHTDFDKNNLKNTDVAEKFIDTIHDQMSVNGAKEFINRFYMNDRMVKKELDRLENTKHKKIVLDYIIERWNEENSEIFTSHANYIKKYRTMRDYLSEEKMFRLYDIFFHAMANFMGMHVDMYFLSRFLKGFKSSESVLPYNSIVYTGDLHSENYRKFLTKLGFTQESLIIDDFLTDKNLLTQVEKDVVIIEKKEDKDNPIVIRSAACLHIDEKKMYPMFGVKKLID